MKEANKLIKQRFNDFMKAEGFVKQKRTTSQFFRVKEHFIQHFWLNISSHVPEIECYIYPAYLYENGYSIYAKKDLFLLQEQLPKEHQKIDFVDIIDDFGKYPSKKLDEVWNNNKYLMKEIMIPYLDTMNFEKTDKLFMDKKDEMFNIQTGTEFQFNIIELTLAGIFLLKGDYPEGYKRLKEVKNFFFQKAQQFKGEDDWLFETKADYINKLLRILEDKAENWECTLQNEIAEAEKITLRMFGMRI